MQENQFRFGQFAFFFYIIPYLISISLFMIVCWIFLQGMGCVTTCFHHCWYIWTFPCMLALCYFYPWFCETADACSSVKTISFLAFPYYYFWWQSKLRGHFMHVQWRTIYSMIDRDHTWCLHFVLSAGEISRKSNDSPPLGFSIAETTTLSNLLH